MNSREDLLQAADEAWQRHSQPIKLPAGADSTIQPCCLMAQRGFKLALIEVVEKLCGKVQP